jgi:hypothetical protein
MKIRHQGIDIIAVEALTANRRRVVFTSAHSGMCHQLYSNGRLVDWTDSPEKRSLTTPARMHAQDLCVIAVEPGMRDMEFSPAPEDDTAVGKWHFEKTLVRPSYAPRDATLHVHDDHATGVLDETPLYSVPILPASACRWGFGLDDFSRNGFGFDGGGAPGLGRGSFGAGAFGFNAETLSLRIPLPKPGTHELRVRVTQAGVTTTGEPIQVYASPPPAAPQALEFSGYDGTQHRLTLTLRS